MKTNSSQASKKKLNCLTIIVNQCSLLSHNSVMPTDLPELANKCLDSIRFSSSDMLK